MEILCLVSYVPCSDVVIYTKKTLWEPRRELKSPRLWSLKCLFFHNPSVRCDANFFFPWCSSFSRACALNSNYLSAEVWLPRKKHNLTFFHHFQLYFLPLILFLSCTDAKLITTNTVFSNFRFLNLAPATLSTYSFKVLMENDNNKPSIISKTD